MKLFDRTDANNATEIAINSIKVREVPIRVHKVRFSNDNGFVILSILFDEKLEQLFPNLNLGHNKYTFAQNTTVSLKGNLGYRPYEGETIIAVDLSVESDSREYGVTLTAKQLYAERLSNFDESGNIVLNEKFSTFDNVAEFLGNVTEIKGVKSGLIKRLFISYQQATQLTEFECIKSLTETVIQSEKAFIDLFSNITIRESLRNALPELHKKWLLNINAQNIQTQLAGYGFTKSEVAKLLKHFGNTTIERLTNNPYEAISVQGIGWDKADRMAEKLGIPLNDKRRIIAGVEAYYQEKTTTSGNTLLLARESYLELLNKFCLISEDDKKLLLKYLTEQFERGNAYHLYPFLDENNKTINYFTNDNDFRVEFYIAKQLVELNKLGRNISAQSIELCKPIIEKDEVLRNGTRVKLDPSQTKAIYDCLAQPVSILTGGAGCGKTTILKRLIECALRLGLKVQLCAPTGKAAKRMTESVNINGITSTTIHSLIGYGRKNSKEKKVSGQSDIGSRSQHHKKKSLQVDWLFVDESSMTDIYLAKSLIKALPIGARVTFIGDPNQLPSVLKGCFFFDIIDSGRFNVAKLTKTHRQADGNDINDVAHAILTGSAKALDLLNRKNVKTKNYDSYLKPQNGHTYTQREVNSIISNELIEEYSRLVKQYGIENVQVLTPARQKDSPLSSNTLNPLLRGAVLHNYNVNSFCKGDRVIGMQNNKIFRNGEVGTVIYINEYEKMLGIKFDGEDEIKNCFEEQNKLDFAYAITCHKSQGSEYKHVLIPMSNSDIFMLDKNWFYTAVTRGKEYVHLFVQSKSVQMAVRKQSTRRLTLLRYLLTGIRQVRPSDRAVGKYIL